MCCLGLFQMSKAWMNAGFSAKHCKKASASALAFFAASRNHIEGNCVQSSSQCSLAIAGRTVLVSILQWISQIFQWHSKTGQRSIKIYLLCTDQMSTVITAHYINTNTQPCIVRSGLSKNYKFDKCYSHGMYDCKADSTISIWTFMYTCILVNIS